MTTTASPPTTGLQTTIVAERVPVRLVLVLGALVALGPLTIDLYLPALPSITDDLLTTSAAVQLTLTGTLLGVAAGQLVVGPLSDALGRRAPLLAGLAVHVSPHCCACRARASRSSVASACCRASVPRPPP